MCQKREEVVGDEKNDHLYFIEIDKVLILTRILKYLNNVTLNHDHKINFFTFNFIRSMALSSPAFSMYLI